MGAAGGSGTFSGYLYGQGNNLISLVNGSGTETLSGTLNFTCPTTVNQGVLALSDPTVNPYYTSSFSIGSGGTLQVNTPDYGHVYATTISGNGVYQKTGPGLWDLMTPGASNNLTYMSMSQGGLIDVAQGELRLGNGPNMSWANNQAGLEVDSGAYSTSGTAPRSTSKR